MYRIQPPFSDTGGPNKDLFIFIVMFRYRKNESPNEFV